MNSENNEEDIKTEEKTPQKEYKITREEIKKRWSRRRKMLYLMVVILIGLSFYGFTIEKPTDLQLTIIKGWFYLVGSLLISWFGLSTTEDNFGDLKNVFKFNK